jgi:hypothetical protein
MSDFSEAVSSETYTYEASYQAGSDGDYTATLNEAADASGNDGASGQSVSLTVGSSSTTGTVVVDNFEETELDWTIDSGTRERLEFSTEAAEGSYSLHFLQASEDTSTNISKSLTSPQSPSEFSLWFRYESSNDNNFRIQLHNSDDTKILEFREFFGSIHYRDAKQRGGYVPHSDIAQVDQNTWYQLAIENIDFSNYTFDATVYDINNNVVNNVEEVGFWNESNEISEIRINNGLGNDGNPDPLWIDNITYIP